MLASKKHLQGTAVSGATASGVYKLRSGLISSQALHVLFHNTTLVWSISNALKTIRSPKMPVPPFDPISLTALGVATGAFGLQSATAGRRFYRDSKKDKVGRVGTHLGGKGSGERPSWYQADSIHRTRLHNMRPRTAISTLQPRTLAKC